MATVKTDLAGMARFWRQFGLLISSGVPVLRALEIQRAEASAPDMREAVESMAAAVRQGKSLSQAISQRPGLFSASVVALCQAGEAAGALDKVAERIAAGLENGALGAPSGDATAAPVVEPSEEAVAKKVSEVILAAVRGRASDIHLEALREGGQVRLRIDGVLQRPEPLDRATYDAVMSRLMLMSGLNVGEKRRPQDGRIQLKAEGRELDLRVSVCPFIYGLGAVARVLDRAVESLSVEKLGFSPEALEELKGWSRRDSGIHLIGGPTGSGKTTVLYAVTKLCAREGVKVLSAESPVEFAMDGVLQAQTMPALGMSFPTLIRSFLRMDPDVILVGEIRDNETVQMMAQAALTGHLVLSSLHTDTATEIPRRLADIGLVPWLVSIALGGAASMRLVRKVCAQCASPCSGADLAALEGVAGAEELNKGKFVRGKGCEACRGSGYRGRAPVIEFLPMTRRIKDLIARNVSPEELRRAAIEEGMVTLRRDALSKAAQGVTTLDEAMMVPEP